MANLTDAMKVFQPRLKLLVIFSTYSMGDTFL